MHALCNHLSHFNALLTCTSIIRSSMKRNYVETLAKNELSKLMTKTSNSKLCDCSKFTLSINQYQLIHNYKRYNEMIHWVILFMIISTHLSGVEFMQTSSPSELGGGSCGRSPLVPIVDYSLCLLRS